MINPHLQRTEILIRQNRFDLAENEARQAISLDPDEPYSHAYLAMCMAERRDWTAATEAARRAVAIDPGIPFVHYALASVLHDRNMHREAEEAIDEALRLEPDAAQFWALKAAIELGQKEYRGTLEAAERGLELDAENEACINLRAVALTNLGDRSAAAAAIDSTLSRNPLNPASHANMGWTLLHQGEARRAMEHFREALRLDPNMEWARAGIVEAMKARSRIYRFFLAYFLLMGRLRGRGQWAILVGGYIAFQVLRSVRASNPSLAVFLTPLITAYFVFAIGTIVSVPLFNLFLLLSKFGRHVLRKGQRWGAAVFGASLLPGATFLAMWAAVGGIEYELCAMFAGLLVIPIALAGLASAGRARWVMTGLAAILTLACAVMCALIFQNVVIQYSVPVYVVGCLGSTWLSNVFTTAPAARKD